MEKFVLTKRDIWFLHYLLDFPIIRYMMCNARNRHDGAEKADVHFEISSKLAMFLLCEGTQRDNDSVNIFNTKIPIHDFLATVLTDSMDEVIGYPIDKDLYSEDFAFYGERFFNVVVSYLPVLDVYTKFLTRKCDYDKTGGLFVYSKRNSCVMAFKHITEEEAKPYIRYFSNKKKFPNWHCTFYKN